MGKVGNYIVLSINSKNSTARESTVYYRVSIGSIKIRSMDPEYQIDLVKSTTDLSTESPTVQ